MRGPKVSVVPPGRCYPTWRTSSGSSWTSTCVLLLPRALATRAWFSSTSGGSRTSNARMRGALLDTIAHSQLLQGDANDSKAGAVQVRARPSPPSPPCGTHCSCGGGARFEWMAVRSSWAWVRYCLNILIKHCTNVYWQCHGTVRAPFEHAVHSGHANRRSCLHPKAA